MAKRLTCSDKWDDPWFSELSKEYKLLWIYILDKCDFCGFYKVNKKNANFSIETELDWDDIDRVLTDRVHPVNQHKWFIPKFIEFQYGELQETNRIHNKVIRILKKEGVLTLCTQSNNKPKDKEQDKDMDKDKVKDKVKHGEFVKLKTEEYSKLLEKFGLGKVIEYINRLNNYIGSSGKKYKSHYHTILSWSTKDEKDNKKSKFTDVQERNLLKVEELDNEIRNL